MANQSIFAAFERMWQHIIAKLGETESEIDTKFSTLVGDTPVADQINTAIDNIDIDIPNIPIEKGGTGHTTIEDTIYTDARYRASSLHPTETTPAVNGTITWTYE